MLSINLKIIQANSLEDYKSGFAPATLQNFKNKQESELSTTTFNYHTSVPAVFSSRIEGEDIELDSFIKHKRLGVKYQPDYTRKIDDLYDAYQFAQQSPLSEKTVKQAHAILTKHILHKSGQGKFRTGNMFVLTKDGRIEYVAAAPEKVKDGSGKVL